MSHSSSSAFSASGIGTHDTIIIPRHRAEPRCSLIPALAKEQGAEVVEIEPLVRRQELLDTIFVPGEGRETLPLRDPIAVAAWLRSLPGRVLIDISCLPHAVWAALVRASVLEDVDIVALYAEPERYEALETTVMSHEVDLSLSIEGVGPLPGFSTISPTGPGRTIVFLLGFEGGRVGHVAATIGVDSAEVRAIVGSPGMRTGYDSAAVEANRSVLERLGLAIPSDLLPVAADDPFAVCDALGGLVDEADSSHLVLVPLGPRPHALGAVLFYLAAELAGTATPQLVYDHAVRDPGGSVGIGTIHLYSISEFRKGVVSSGQL